MRNDSHFSDLSEEEKDWLDAYLDGTIEPQDFESLQNRMMESPVLRALMRRYLALDNSLRNESGEAGFAEESVSNPWLKVEGLPAPKESDSKKIISFPGLAPLVAAACLAFLLGSALMYWKSLNDDTPGGGSLVHSNSEEPSAQGFAVIEKLFEAAWPESGSPRREGDTLGAEVFRLTSGTAEIQFFSGAMMTVEGPAEISLKSAWEASCTEGAVRMQVPPAARGFKLQAPSTEIIDLGTEFGLVVRDGKGHVEVFDGEIAVHQKGEKETLVKKGSALGLASDGTVTEEETGKVKYPDAKRFGSQAVEQQRLDFERWKAHRDDLANDDRLIAYYTFDRKESGSLIPNLTVPRSDEFDGAVVLAEPVDGRWPGLKSALEFRRPGSRVRVNLPGEFTAFTFMTWVRIDSLDRWYNALFMADRYETGEPHWQIREDGQMMLSVMVDDSRPDPKNPEGPSIRFQHLYYSPPMWDPSMSGQWLHLASVFDPENRRVSHYVNGERISREEIQPKFLIQKLRIGNGEIGNWGQPFREDPTFAIRNLNGRMDEIAIFKVALEDEEIVKLYDRSRSGR